MNRPNSGSTTPSSALAALLAASAGKPLVAPAPPSGGLAALLGSSARSAPASSSSLLAALLGTPAPAPTPSPPRWIAVRKRFEQFARNLNLTIPQIADGVTKYQGVVGCLNRHYYGGAAAPADVAFPIGSWAKGTATRPPRDVDLYFVLPPAVHARFEAYQWNRQSALLQEVKDVLAATYPATDMRGDGQVVVVQFESYAVEVVPAFLLVNGRYWICDTNGGGKYKTTDPVAERSVVDAVDKANAGNLRQLVRMLKAWQDYCSVPIKSFALELVAAEFLAQSEWRLNDFFYYDWLVRDFFLYLYAKAGKVIVLPGTGEVIALGDDWKSRVVTAYSRAVEACDNERDNYLHLAGDEWQKIFGPQVPVAP